MGKIVDTLIVFRILRMLTTPFNQTDAYKFGFIDKDGNRIKFKKSETGSNQRVKNDPKTKEERDSYTPLHKLVFNLKRIIEKVPFGKSRFASYAVALTLLKEQAELSDNVMDNLTERFLKMLDEDGDLGLQLTEHVEQLELGRTYQLKRKLTEQNDTTYAEKTEVTIIAEQATIFNVPVYAGLIGGDTIMVTADDLC